MIEIQDADSDVGKIGLEKPPKASGTITDENHLLGRGHAPSDSFEPQPFAQVIDRAETLTNLQSTNSVCVWLGAF